MVSNFPGPYEVRMRYTTTPAGLAALEHTQRLNLQLTADPNPGDSFTNINVVTRGGVSTPALSQAMEDWIALIAPRFETTAVFGQIELWKYATQSFDATFVSSYNPMNTAGSSAQTTQDSKQAIYTFRTIEGGILRINLLEGIDSAKDPLPYPTASPDINAIFDFVTGTTNWVLARDTSYPFSALRYSPGENEKLFRTRHR